MENKVNKKIALILVTYNQKDVTAKTIGSLLEKQTVVPDIIVVDNFSNDRTKEFIEKRFPTVTVLRTKGNYGGSGGQYVGTRYAYEHGYEWIIMSDNDAIPISDNLIEELVKNASENVITQPWNTFGKDYNNDMFAMHYACYNRNIINKVKFPLFEFFLFYDDVEYSYRIKKAEFKIKKLKKILYWHPIKRSILPSRLYFHIRNWFNIYIIYEKPSKVLLETIVLINSLFAYKIIKEKDFYIFGMAGIKNFLKKKNDNTYIMQSSKIYSKIVSLDLKIFQKKNHEAIVSVYNKTNEKLKMKNRYGKIKKIEWIVILLKSKSVIIESVDHYGSIFSGFLFGKKLIVIEDINDKKIFFREYILPIFIKKIWLLFIYNLRKICLISALILKVIGGYIKKDDLYRINKKYDDKDVKDFLV